MADRLTIARAAGYLAGMIDGEGHVSGPRNGRATAGGEIEIVNTEADIVSAVTCACDALGIRVKVFWRPGATANRKPYARMRIGGVDNLVRVWRLVPIGSARKRNALAAQLALYSRSKVLPLAEELAEMYLGGMSANEIGAKYGVDAHAILQRLRRQGVEIRPRLVASAMGQRKRWGKAA